MQLLSFLQQIYLNQLKGRVLSKKGIVAKVDRAVPHAPSTASLEYPVPLFVNQAAGCEGRVFLNISVPIISHILRTDA